jgi:peptidoglycan/xylan/chitin deacetylase (PgdA/CDA1 family)
MPRQPAAPIPSAVEAVMSLKRRVFDLGRRTGALRAVAPLYGRRRITVLAYHRVVDGAHPGFDTDRRTVSATPDGFREQMDYVSERFTPIALGDLISWLDGATRLPERPVLVTFDDGYRDNLLNAWPVMREREIPGVLLVAAGHVGTVRPFVWDLAAWCFRHTSRSDAELPGWGRASWSGPEERRRILDAWSERCKALPDEERTEAAHSLPGVLEVTVPPDAFRGVYLDWDEVRALDAAGFTAGAHTMSHPILTRVSPERARREIADSAARVAAEVGHPAEAFAYPNGLPGDLDDEVVAMVREAGFRVGFTLSPGPSRPAEVAARPLSVRRVYVHHGDHLSRFVARIEGASRVTSGLRPGRVPGR